jgi:DtxR family transcriptional regulator, Mn-dependent transcriptional regulator
LRLCDPLAAGKAVMGDEFHPVVDEYLKTIGWLEEEGTPVIAARIAARLEKSRPSVSEMLERLAARGYVERSGRQVTLSEAGRQRALTLVRRHRLAECLLADVIGLPWESVHVEAGRFATVMSDDVEERLVELLNHPAVCPHGNRIPGVGSANRDADDAFALADASPGQSVRLVRVGQKIEQDRALLEYLGRAGFTPGVPAVILERAPDDTLVLALGSGKLALGAHLALSLFVCSVEGSVDPGREQLGQYLRRHPSHGRPTHA